MMMVKKAEGAEKTMEDKDYHSVVRGGQKVGYFNGYPHPSGAWVPKLDDAKNLI